MGFNFRKILIIGIVITGSLVLIMGAWMLFSNPNNNSGGKKIQNNISQNLKPAAKTENNIGRKSQSSSESNLDKKIKEIQKTQKIQKLSNRAVLGIGLNPAGDKVLYYDKETGQLFDISFDGRTWEKLSDILVSGISRVQWSLTRNRAILTTKENRLYVYDYAKNKLYPLSRYIHPAVFSPDGQKILYHFWDPQRQSDIAIANYDGSGWRELIPSEMVGLKLYWPREDTLAFLTPGGSFYGRTLYFAKLSSPSNLKELLNGDRFGLEVNWSPTGNKLLYSQYLNQEDKDHHELYLRDFNTEKEDSLQLDVSARNCTWARDEESVYCAVPTQKLLDIIPRSYQKKLSLAGESFWRINIASREIQEVYIPKKGEQIYEPSELIVSDNNDFLFFVNKLDGKLYNLRL